MKIAYDTGPLTSGHAVRGIGFNTSELLNYLEKQRLVTERLIIDGFDFSQNKKSLNSGRYDIIHITSFHPYFLSLPIRHKGKLIVTIHDLIPLVYPKQYSAGIKGKTKLALQKLLLKKVDAVITISETSKKDIVRFLGIPEDQVEVVYIAKKKLVDNKTSKQMLKKVRKEYKLPKKFVLYVGDINFNKNIPTLIKGCKEAKVPLVIVGKQAMQIEDQGMDLISLKGPKDWIRFMFNFPHPEQAHYKKILQEFENGGKIIRTGFVPDEDLAAITSLASVYVTCSLYEGFGLGLLEAMVYGVPVVASRIQAHVEVGGNACLYADLKDPSDFAEKITKLMKDKSLHKKYSQKGTERAKEFSWDKCAKETVKVYQKVLKIK